MSKPDVDTAPDPVIELTDSGLRRDSTGVSGNLANVVAKPLEWLIDGVVPIGKLTVLAGEPDVGTSLLALEMIARVSTGRRGFTDAMSGEENARCGQKMGQAPKTEPVPFFESDLKNSSLLIVEEDEVANTVRPRLQAAGADVSFVEIWSPAEYAFTDRKDAGLEEGKKRRSAADEAKQLAWYRLNRDLLWLELRVRWLNSKGRRLRMVVIDLIDRFFAVSKRPEDMQEITHRLSELACKLDVAIVALTKLKRTGLNRGMINGTQSPSCEALTAKAPSVWVVARDRENLDRRFLLPEKTSLCRRGPGYAFSVQDSRVEWEQARVTMTVEEYLRPKKARRISELDRAELWLKQQLSVGDIPAATIGVEGAKCLFSEITLRRAFHALGGNSEKRKGGLWWWTLTKKETEVGESLAERFSAHSKESSGQGNQDDQGAHPDQGAQFHDAGVGVAANGNRENENKSQTSDFQSQKEDPKKLKVGGFCITFPPDAPSAKPNQPR